MRNSPSVHGGMGSVQGLQTKDETKRQSHGWAKNKLVRSSNYCTHINSKWNTLYKTTRNKENKDLKNRSPYLVIKILSECIILYFPKHHDITRTILPEVPDIEVSGVICSY